METLRRDCFIYLFMPLLLSCYQPQLSSSVEGHKVVYPQWFWTPPTDLPFPTAVGYSAIALFHPDEAKEAAINDGIERLAKSINVRIYGEQSSINGKLSLQFIEETAPQIKQNVQEAHQLLAAYQSQQLTMVLLGLGGAPNLDTRVTKASTIQPDWIEILPRQPGYLYAHGQSLMKSHRPQNAWTNAEYHARITLAQGVKSDIAHLKKASEGRINQVTLSQTDVTLARIETIARWYDAKKRSCHILVRTPIIENAD